VHVEAGAIAAVEPRGDATSAVTLVPGFVDVQVNGIDDIDVAHAHGDDWRRLGRLLLAQGVTSWCPTLVTNALERYAEPLQRIQQASDDSVGPSIISAHIEGPFIGGAPGAHNREMISAIDLDWLASLPPIVRLVTLAPELPKAVAAIQLLAARGVVVSLGHSTPTLANIDAAILAGATMVTHLFNGMSGVHHRDPGLAAAALVDDRLTVGLIADLVHVHPLAIRLAFRSKPDQIALVTDSVGWRAGSIGAVRMALRDGAPRLADGTLAGSALSMDQAMRNLVQACGVPLDVAVRAASTTPARLMGLTDRGEIAVGQRADLVTLDDELRVTGTWVAGERT